MSVSISRGKTDSTLKAIGKVLERYVEDHPKARIDLYRQNSVSVRVRIIDPDFSKVETFQRHDIVNRYFDQLPEEMESEISMLVLLTPKEVKRSASNIEFEDPIPSEL